MKTAPTGDERSFIGLDIGNTRLTVGTANSEGSLLLTEQRGAPEGAEAAIPVLLAMAEKAIEQADATGRRAAGVGLGFGGPVDYERQLTRQSFHSPGWDGKPLAEVFASRLGIPALLDNDANAGGLGEARFGAGRGCHTVLYVNVGTGIGGAVVMGGAVHHGATGSAGEIGHVVLDPDGPPCNCGKCGCVEALASGTALGRMALEAGLDVGDGRGVVAAAEEGNATALEVVARAAESLGLAIANVVNVLDPDIVVLGGGVPEAGRVWWGPLRESFRRHAVPPAAEHTPLMAAQLGYNAGVLGAAALGMEAARQEAG